MATLKLSVRTGKDAATLARDYQRSVSAKYPALQSISQLIQSVLSGNESGSPSVGVSVEENEDKATGTITFGGAGAANDTVLINGVTFTAVASGASGNQWNVGGTAAQSAENLAAAINASATDLVNKHVTATAASGVVTLTAAIPGHAGNAVTIAEGVDAGLVMSVSGPRLTGGAADSSAKTYSF